MSRIGEPFAGYSSMEDCIEKNSGKDNPGAYCASIHYKALGYWPSQKEARHRDFEHVRQMFSQYYCGKTEPCRKGDSEYYDWLSALDLDESKPYGRSMEAFQWAKDMIQQISEDQEHKYYRLLIGFPVESMNGNIYTEKELQQSAEGLDKTLPTLNHFDDNLLKGAVALKNRYEDGAVESVLQVRKDYVIPQNYVCPECVKNRSLVELIDTKQIVNVSLEASCVNEPRAGSGEPCEGMKLLRYSLLTKNVLPGIPTARIFPFEAYRENIIVESRQRQRQGRSKMTVKVSVKTGEAVLPDVKGQCPEGFRWNGETKQCEKTEGCPEGQHWDEASQKCVSDPEEQPEGTDITKGSGPSEDLLSLSEEKLKRFKAEGKVEELVKTVEIKEAYYTKELGEALKAGEQLRGELKATSADRDKFQALAFERDRTILGLNLQINDLTKQNKDLMDSREGYKSDLEKTRVVHEALDKKYKDLLSANLELSDKLRQSNEDYVRQGKELGATKEALNRAKRQASSAAKVSVKVE